MHLLKRQGKWIGLLTVLVLIFQLAAVGMVFSFETQTDPDPDGVQRIFGQDRYETAIAASQAGWDTSDYVILARGDDFADALTSGPLAGVYDAPILLTRPNSLPGAVLVELERLETTHVIIIGGTGAVSDAVKSTLEGAGLIVERVYGGNRYLTAVAIAEKIADSGQLGNTAHIVSGAPDSFADALSIAGIATMRKQPILMVTRTILPGSVEDFLSDHSIANTYVIGGTGVIDDSMLSQLPNPTRLAGGTRYQTNMEVLTYFADEFTSHRVFIATGMNFPDALTGGVLAARFSAPLWLVGTGIGPLSDAYLESIITLETLMYILGGTVAVSEDMMELIEERLAHWQELIMKPTFAVYLNDNWIWGSGWTPGEKVSVTVNTEDPYVTDDPVEWHGHFDIYVEELKPGDQVTVSDGITERTHIVRDLELGDFTAYQDEGEDYLDVSGTTDTDVYPIRVEVLGPSPGPGQGPPTKAVGYADIVGSIWDITLFVDLDEQEDSIFVFQTDADGNSTAVSHEPEGWDPYGPQIMVTLSHGGSIWGHGFPAHADVDVQIERDGATELTIPLQIGEHGDFDINMHERQFEMQVGDKVIVTGEDIDEETVIRPLFITDIAGNVISGTAEADTAVTVTVHKEEMAYEDWPRVETTADSIGGWDADFTTEGYDLQDGDYGAAEQWDENGHITMVMWHLTLPAFEVYPHENWIRGYGWEPGAHISVTINDGVPFVTDDPLDDHGYFDIHVEELEAGDSVKVSDGNTEMTHTVRDLHLGGFTPYEDGGEYYVDVFGATDTDADPIWIELLTPAGYDGPPHIKDAQMAIITPEDGWYSWNVTLQAEIEDHDSIYVFQTDADGNSTAVRHQGEADPEPMTVIQVSMSNGGFVSGWGWPENETVSVEIQRAGAVAFSKEDVETHEHGSFDLWLPGEGFDIEVSDLVTVRYEEQIERSTILKHLLVTETPGDQVIGEAEPLSDILVTLFIGEDYEDFPRIETAADDHGNWSVDFSDIGQILEKDMYGLVEIFDDAGNATMRYWGYLVPQFRVEPENDAIMGFGWRPGSTITVDINGTPHTVIEPADDGGWFYFSVPVQGGDEVTVADGYTTRIHQVTALQIVDLTTHYFEDLHFLRITGVTNTDQMPITVIVSRGGGPDGPPQWLGEETAKFTPTGPDEYFWDADVSLMEPLISDDHIVVFQTDANGNSTLLYRSIP